MSNRVISQFAACIVIGLIAAQEGLAQVNIPKLYGGLGVGTVSFSVEDEKLENLDVDMSVSALSLRFGIRLNKYFAAELRGNLGLNEDSDSFQSNLLDAKVTTDVVTFLGAQALFSIPTLTPFTPYVTLGYGRVKRTSIIDVAADVSGLPLGEKISKDESESAVSYGVGIDWAIFVVTDAFRINAEYVKYGEVDVLSLGFTREF